MPMRSAAFGTLAAMGCCLLPPLGHPAHASHEPPRSTHHKHATLSAPEADLPFFQPGLWEYRRTVVSDASPAPQISILRKCADPSTEIRRKMAQLGHRGCRFAPLAHRRGRYISSWTCPTRLGPTRFRAVLIVRDAARYTDLSEMRAGAQVARQRIEAAWIGECSASVPGGQLR
jgi:hypothetical protein